jgi:DNA polymerase III delta subunit
MESYSEPAVLWRLRSPHGERARATLIPGSPESTLVFFVNDQLDRGENFAEWAQAIARAEVVRADLLERGWTVET